MAVAGPVERDRMQALVHFAVGLAGGLVLLLLVDLQAREEFAVLLASGFWAIAPDFWWAFREFGYESIALRGRAVHQSPISNLFWFHWLLDQLETGNNNLEAGLALALLGVVAVGYYRYNDWSVG